ncbi:MAG: hypothetical protein LBP50_03000 [Tannerella sp.]|jgi:hypothetical protein|nr:hypothetical protein [Tannerella sp.]
MNPLLNYIRGQRKGREAHRIEREAMRDPFLAEALEGFEAVDGLHAERIMSIRKRLSSQMRRTYLRTGRLAAAAGLLLCLLAGSYFLLNRPPLSGRFVAQNESPVETVAAEIASPAPSRESSREYRKQKVAPPTEEVKKPSSPSPVAEDDSPKEKKAISAAEKDTPACEAVAREGKPMARIRTKVNHASEELIEKEAPLPVPEPQIGMKAYREYLAKELIHPSEGACAGVKGTVEIRFRIDALGKPCDFTVKRSLCAKADREAIRLIEQGCRWKGDSAQFVTVEVRF